ncbi:hypothetical protein JG688_00015958 [Phytophthora aleatoria]|uniref:Uncharacterized protein n=1 Tax=Phytophthora aleatoria TaxID=2496075 RepID=A0A8J5IUW6_9STRA|nr:hypothetical protein JG688_00015958 [Phytophthora aleatoria]
MRTRDTFVYVYANHYGEDRRKRDVYHCERHNNCGRFYRVGYQDLFALGLKGEHTGAVCSTASTRHENRKLMHWIPVGRGQEDHKTTGDEVLFAAK